jgi:hypothetical protein
MSRKRRTLAVALVLGLLTVALLLLAAAPTAQATTLVYMSVEELAARATTIVLVDTTATSTRSNRAADGKLRDLQTVAQLHTGQVLKGSPAADFEVAVLGGRLGDLSLVVDGMPTFAPGERCVLFLDEQNRVIGGMQGKLDVTGGMVESLALSLGAVYTQIEVVTGIEPVVVDPVTDTVLELAAADTAEGSGVAAATTPTITSISPGSASAGTGSRVTITGAYFGATRGTGNVNFFYKSGPATIPAAIVSWSDTSIVCEVPVGIVAGYPGSAGSGPVTVTDSAGTTSAGYSFEVTFGYGGYKQSGLTCTYYVNANTADTTSEEALFDAGAAAWNPASAFKFVDGGATTATSFVPNGSYEVFWTTNLQVGVLAAAYYWYSGTTFLESDIGFNDYYAWSSGTAGTYDIQSIASHELGHWLNLRDLYGTADSNKVMYGFGSAGEQKRSLAAGDAAGILWIYGSGTPTVPVVNAGSDATINEGGTFTGSGSFTDPGAETWTATVNYGDGSGTQALTLTGKTFGLSHAYTQQGSYTVTVTVTDSIGGSGSDTATVTVNNVVPSVNAGSDATINEGGTFTNSGSFTDPGADTWTATVNYGDGSGSQALALTGKTFSLSHRYTQQGSFTVTVTVTDNASASGSDTAIVTVNNVAPVVNAGPDATISESGTFAGSGSFTDPGADTWTGTVNYGDGGGAQALTLTGSTFSLSHAYTQQGSYTVTVTVSDGTASGSDTATVTVNNVVPSVNAGSDATINEGSTFTSSGSFTDPGADTWTATVNYGDGSGSQALTLTGKTFSLSHVYSEAGIYTVTVTVGDGTASGSDTAAATVNNVAPTVDAGAGGIAAEGSTLASSGSFTDPGADTWTATVDYGDGSGSQALTLTGKTFSLSHTYADSGVYTVTVTVRDNHASTGSDTCTATVSNVAPTVDAGAGGTVAEGSTFTGSGRFTDPGADDWTAIVNYGDGSGDQALTLTGKTFNLSHTYASDGEYTFTVWVFDGDGGNAWDTGVVTVTPPAPTIKSVAPNAGTTAGGTSVTITGADFTGATAVTFGSLAASFDIVSDTQIAATAPAQAAGVVQVKVTGTYGISDDTSSDDYTYLATTRSEDGDAKLTYLGNWVSTSIWSASGGSLKSTAQAGAAVVVKFDGTGVKLYAKTAPWYGQALVSIDGGPADTVEFYSGAQVYKALVYTKTGLSPGIHTMTIKCAGTKLKGASGTSISLDALEIVGSLAQADALTRSQQDNVNLEYTGSWATSAVNWWLFSGGTMSSANASGSAVNITFSGSYCAWYAAKGAGYGQAKVILDGGAPVTVDLYAASSQIKQKVYETGLLDNKAHTLSIYWTGTKSAAATGTAIDVDAVDILGTLTDAPRPDPIEWRYQENDSRVAVVGSWVTTSTWSASGGSVISTAQAGAAVVVKFDGTGVKLYAKTAPWYGQALVSIDGGPADTVEFYSGAQVYKALVYTKTGLSPGMHTMTIKCAGTKLPGASGTSISLDALDIVGYLAPATTRVQENDTGYCSKGGTWTTTSGNWAYSGGGYLSTDASGAKITITFTGTYLSWVAKTVSYYGKARVTLEDPAGAKVETIVDLYSAGTVYKKAVYNTGLLLDGKYTVVIERLGTKNPASYGTSIGVDAFDLILGAP